MPHLQSESRQWLASLHHDGSARYVTPQDPQPGDRVTLRLRMAAQAPVKAVYLRTAPDGESRLDRLTEAQPAAKSGDLMRWWQITIPVEMPLTNYRFAIETDDEAGGGLWWLNAAGVLPHQPTDAHDFKLLAGHPTPHWVREAVFYQIFPERFADGDPSNNVQDGQYDRYGVQSRALLWGDPPPELRQGRGMTFFGGDLQGIIQHLDHIAALGANVLYLNPIFLSPSNHKYDCADFRQVDPHLGGDAALIALRAALDARGMRLVLDITPNHVGAHHPWFVVAYADHSAPSAEYFTFYDEPREGPFGPVDYACWLGHGSLPKLNYTSAALRDEIYAGENAVIRYWLREPFRIDGWRLDVANMTGRQGQIQMNQAVLRGIHQAVKAENPAAYILGENWFDATPNLQGDQMDGNMNYQGFSLPMLHWLDGLSPLGNWAHGPRLDSAALAAHWRDYLGAIPWPLALVQLNLLGSHDTPRIIHLLQGDADKLAVALTLLFTFPGAPSIYYGDEIGIGAHPQPGERERENRQCMIWDETQWDKARLTLYKQLVHARRTSPALKHGGFQVIYAAGETVAYLRETPDEQLIVEARRGPDTLGSLPIWPSGISDGAQLRDILSGARATVADGHLPLPGDDAAATGSVPGPVARIWRVET